MRYEIEGNNLPVVICHLEEGEKIITEQGAMAWMTPNMKMETNSNGIGRAVARTFSGESFFQNIYYPCRGRGKGMINFHTANLRPTKSLGVREPRVWLSETKRKTPECSGVSFFRAGNSNSLTNAFHICVYVHLCVVPRYIASQHPWKQSQSLLQNTKETTAGHFRRSVFLLSGRIPGVHELLWKAASLSCGRYR